MPGKGLRGIFKKRPKDEAQSETSGQPRQNEGRDLSMQYVSSPSALDYPGIKRSERQKELKPDMEAQVVETEKSAKAEDDLPRCPQCGWAIGYEDNVCMNCGFKLR